MPGDTDKRRNRGDLADQLRREIWLRDLKADAKARASTGSAPR
ncbi:hypothetical protein [Sphingomonas sp. CFBP 8764]|nr:hypothetical protein [Sphingomonas sp. CFBP 8764]